MATAYSIPEAILLPWGYLVRVVQVPPDHPELENRHAAWDTDTQTIWLDKSKPMAELRWCLMHEMDHAYTDWKGWANQNMNVKAPEAYEAPEEEDSE